MRRETWLIAALATGAFLIWATPRRRGIVLPGEPEEASPAQLPGPIESIWNEATMPTQGPIYDPRDYQARRGNLRAFLDMLAHSEGTNGPDGYRTLVGGSLFYSFDDHPALTGEWSGFPLTDQQCIDAGQKPGCVSTAAGRYQIIRPTWRSLKASLGLLDFTPDSQDRAAEELLRQAGALGLIEEGRFDAAVERVRRIWASLPGAGYGQHENDLDALRDVYASAGGSLA